MWQMLQLPVVFDLHQAIQLPTPYGHCSLLRLLEQPSIVQLSQLLDSQILVLAN